MQLNTTATPHGPKLTGGFPVIWDSGASLSISNSQKDFVNGIQPSSVWQKVTGLAKGLQIKGQGYVMWGMYDVNGELRLIKLPAYYIPSSPTRLLSTTSFTQMYEKEQKILDIHAA